MNDHILPYDFKRDGGLKPGETLLVYEDGTTELQFPPERDLKAPIRLEHARAELQRLDEGMDGCGCDMCQALYRRIDMAKYGNRVLAINGWVVVRAAPPVKKTLPNDEWIHSDLVYCLDSLAWGIAADGKSVILGKINEVGDYFRSGEADDLKPEAVEILNQIKEWESKQGGTRTISDQVVRVCNQRGGLVQVTKRDQVNDRQPAVQQRSTIL